MCGLPADQVATVPRAQALSPSAYDFALIGTEACEASSFKGFSVLRRLAIVPGKTCKTASSACGNGLAQVPGICVT